MKDHLPAFGICGWSGSGKTTVIEEAVRRLTGRGLRVGVVKHDVHGLNIDKEGKDSDKFFKAGADVIMRGPAQSFLRSHRTGDSPLIEVLKLVSPYYDLVLVEGHKSTQLYEKVWVLKEEGEKCPPEAANVKRILRRDEDRVAIVMDMIDSWLPGAWCSPPVYAGILIGPPTVRGSAKGDQSGLAAAVEAVAERVEKTVLLGHGTATGAHGKLSVLPDVPDALGPVAAMRSAMRWHPTASWVFLPCDLPGLSSELIEWLLATRGPGVWATMPKLPGARQAEPFPAHYDPRARHLLEQVAAPSAIAASPKVITPTLPEALAAGWPAGAISAPLR